MTNGFGLNPPDLQNLVTKNILDLFALHDQWIFWKAKQGEQHADPDTGDVKAEWPQTSKEYFQQLIDKYVAEMLLKVDMIKMEIEKENSQ